MPTSAGVALRALSSWLCQSSLTTQGLSSRSSLR